MPTESPQDREDRITQRVLAFGTLILTGGISGALIFREIPPSNETLLGTVVGFIFGNMTGPVFRKIFGGPDTGTRQAVSETNDLVKSVVSASNNQTPVPASEPAQSDTPL